MKPGDVICVRGTSPFDRAIEDVERGPYSHCALIISDTQVIEAVAFYGVRYNDMSFYRGQDVFTYPGLTDGMRAGIVAWAKAHVGCHYALSLLAWELIRYTLHLCLPWYVLPGGFICSTFASDAYVAGGVNLWTVKYPSPDDVAGKLVKIGTV